MAEGHERLETNTALLVSAVLVVISFGGLVTVVPLFNQNRLLEPVEGLELYPPLELAGRDVYVREGCYVLAKLGAMPVDKVGSAAVYEVLRPIALAGKHATVKMAGTAITAVLEWARIAEFRTEGSPVETVRRRLPKRAGGPKHYDALHFSQVGGALARIDATNCAPSTKRAIRFTALTALRQVEVRRAAWDQLDLEAATWVKPAQATKTAKSHRVPLSRHALDVLAEARKGNRGALVFPGTRPGAMMGNVVMTQALRNAGVAASGHGFRSSFKGWARQHDVDELLSEFALAHVEGSATVAAYARDDLLEKRRPVMQAWADCISA